MSCFYNPTVKVGVNGKLKRKYMKSKFFNPAAIGMFLASAFMAVLLINMNFVYGQDQVVPPDENQNATSTRVDANEVDKRYLSQMANRSREVASISDQVSQSAQNDSTRQVAAQIKNEQAGLAYQAQQLYRQLYNSEIPTGTSTPEGTGTSTQDGTGTDTPDQRSPGQNPEQSLDKEYFEQLIPYLQMKIVVSTMMMDAYPREEIRNIAQGIIQTEKSELDNLRNVYYNRYPQQ